MYEEYSPIRIPDSGRLFVCPCHFEDDNLRQHIERTGEIGTCSFCRKEVKVIDFANFIEYVKDVVYRYFGTLDDENIPLELFHENSHGFGLVREIQLENEQTPHINLLQSLSTSSLLQELDLVTDDDILNGAIEDCFDMGQEWIRHNPMSFTDGEWVSYYWESFCKTIKSRRRFTIDEYEFEGDHYGDTLSYKDVISRIFSAINDAQMCITLPQGTRLYRSRVFDKKPIILKFDDLTSAPYEYAKQNRMSPAGISMFYSSLQAQTNLAELRPTRGVIVTGRFTLKKDVRILDLTSLPSLSYWGKGDIGEMEFLHDFSKEVSRPIDQDDRIHIEYLPTQAFTEYIRYRFKDHDGKSLDGIMFNSSKPDAGKNVVLFCDQDESSEYVELTDIKIQN